MPCRPINRCVEGFDQREFFGEPTVGHIDDSGASAKSSDPANRRKVSNDTDDHKCHIVAWCGGQTKLVDCFDQAIDDLMS